MSESGEDSVAGARAVLAKMREDLEKVEVRLPVKTLKDARSQKVLDYCLLRLSEGASYELLRRELGLGPSWKDKKWREIRKILVSTLLPKTDEEAMLQSRDETAYWLDKMEEMVNELDDRISYSGEVTYDKGKMFVKGQPEILLRTKLETIKALIEQKRSFFEDYVKIQTLRKKESSTRGASIVIVNNIPRPDSPRDVSSEVIKIAKKLGEQDESE